MFIVYAAPVRAAVIPVQPGSLPASDPTTPVARTVTATGA